MKFRPFQTLLIAATIVTCGAPLQADFYVTNNTKYNLVLHSGSPHFGPSYISGYAQNQKVKTSLSEFTIDVCYGECKKNVSCKISPNGFLTINLASDNGLSVNCAEGS